MRVIESDEPHFVNLLATTLTRGICTWARVLGKSIPNRSQPTKPKKVPEIGNQSLLGSTHQNGGPHPFSHCASVSYPDAVLFAGSRVQVLLMHRNLGDGGFGGDGGGDGGGAQASLEFIWNSYTMGRVSPLTTNVG